MTRSLLILACIVTTVPWCGCQSSQPEQRCYAPPEFFQPACEVQPRPELRMQLPGYRLNFADELEIIYQVSHDVQGEPYTLQIEDRINVRFPFQPELNQTLQIPSDGHLNLLLIDKPIKAYGRTAEELTRILRQEYEKQIQQPQLTVTIDQANVKVEELKRAITTSPRGQSRLVPIRPDGRISLPYVGDVMAYGLTVEELHESLNRAYREAGIEGIDVTASVLIVAPVKVYVAGEVFRPGMVKLSHQATLTQAIASAGGWVRGRASADKVLLIRRRGMPVPTAAVIDVEYLTQGLGDQARHDKPVDAAAHRFDPFVKDDDIIYVPSNKLAKNADWIRIVFTQGIYGVLPFSTSVNYTVADSVEWLGNDGTGR